MRISSSHVGHLPPYVRNRNDFPQRALGQWSQRPQTFPGARCLIDREANRKLVGRHHSASEQFLNKRIVDSVLMSARGPVQLKI